MEDPNYATPRKRKYTGIDLNKKPQQRPRLKVRQHRARIYDVTKPKKIPKKKVVKARVPRSEKVSELSRTKPNAKLPKEEKVVEMVSKYDLRPKNAEDTGLDWETPTVRTPEPLSPIRPTRDRVSDFGTSYCRRTLDFDLGSSLKDVADENVIQVADESLTELRNDNLDVEPVQKELVSTLMDPAKNDRIASKIINTYYRRKWKKEEFFVFKMLIDILGSEVEDFGSSCGMRQVLNGYQEENTQPWVLKDFPMKSKRKRTRRSKRSFYPNLAKAVKVYNGNKGPTRKRSGRNRRRHFNYEGLAMPAVVGGFKGKRSKRNQRIKTPRYDDNLVLWTTKKNITSVTPETDIVQVPSQTFDTSTVSMISPPELDQVRVQNRLVPFNNLVQGYYDVQDANLLMMQQPLFQDCVNQLRCMDMVLHLGSSSENSLMMQPPLLQNRGWKAAPGFENMDFGTSSTNLLMMQPPLLQNCVWKAALGIESMNYDKDVDFIEQKLRSLHIDDMRDYHQKSYHELVPYQNLNQELVSVKIKPPKLRKPVPKVDLDAETLRVWDRLMGNDPNADTEEHDEEKAKYWEREREIFSKRVDAFIARMHLVQGNRKFSRWKGSVVDSIVGVYLTQNVSDNLSSTAFMSLASAFPPSEYDHNNGTLTTNECDNNNDNCAEDIISSQEPTGSYVVTEEFTLSLESTGRNDVSLQFTLSQESTGSNDVSERLTSETDATESSEFQEFGICENVEEIKGNFSIHTSENQLLNSVEDVGTEEKLATQEISSDYCSTYEECLKCFDSINNHRQASEGKSDAVTSLEANISTGPTTSSKKKKEKLEKKEVDWDEFKRIYGTNKPKTADTKDAVNWNKVRNAPVGKIANSIAMRGQHNILALKIKAFLERVAKHFHNIDLECLRTAPPDYVKEFLLSIHGIGLKSTECVRLLALEHHAFPVDTNVGRIAVRLGWVPLQPLPGNLELDLLTQYPLVDSIQKYLWPRLCQLDQRTLYELHYQLITFGKVFCTKRKPKCGECPLRSSCKYYASKYARENHSLPAPPQEKSKATTNLQCTADEDLQHLEMFSMIPLANMSSPKSDFGSRSADPIIEHPDSPVRECTLQLESNYVCDNSNCYIGVSSPERLESMVQEPIDIEDLCRDRDPYGEGDDDDDEEIPTITLDTEEFRETVAQLLRDKGMHDVSKALIPVTPEAPIPTPKLKIKNRLWTALNVYELNDDPVLMEELGLDKREPEDPSHYLLAIQGSGDSSNAFQERCNSEASTDPSNEIQARNTCDAFVTIMIPCRTANRGSFPLNGTYFQVNEVFADRETSERPIAVQRKKLRHLKRKPLFCGFTASSIFRDMNLLAIQHCFWKGYLCVRGFDRETRVPQNLPERFHPKGGSLKNFKEEYEFDEYVANEE